MTNEEILVRIEQLEMTLVWEFRRKGEKEIREMGAIEDVRNLMQDIVAPDIKAIKAQLNSLENRVDRLDKKIDSNHTDVMAAIGRIVDYKDVIERLNKLEERLPKQ